MMKGFTQIRSEREHHIPMPYSCSVNNLIYIKEHRAHYAYSTWNKRIIAVACLGRIMGFFLSSSEA